jgi:hypothetical protein
MLSMRRLANDRVTLQPDDPAPRFARLRAGLEARLVAPGSKSKSKKKK